jgi:tetraprenyl-beta-curcumene synthase
VVSLTVAMQTISDYLDNLCDRAGVCHERGFRTLHRAMLATLSAPGTGHHGFYDHFPYRDDGGYLQALVARCQHHAYRLPALPVVRGRAAQLLELYSDLQVLKHLHPGERVSRLQAWHARRGGEYPQLAWQEFAAACGSTLGIFALLAAAAWHDLDEATAAAIHQAYFPAVCTLHILLDYFIDQREDAQHGDLNFCRVYSSAGECARRIAHFTREARRKTASLPQAKFHLMVVQGLVAVYLSDPKSGSLEGTCRDFLEAAGPGAHAIYQLCRILRRYQVLAPG